MQRSSSPARFIYTCQEQICEILEKQASWRTIERTLESSYRAFRQALSMTQGKCIDV